jgi:hypothetical protein
MIARGDRIADTHAASGATYASDDDPELIEAALLARPVRLAKGRKLAARRRGRGTDEHVQAAGFGAREPPRRGRRQRRVVDTVVVGDGDQEARRSHVDARDVFGTAECGEEPPCVERDRIRGRPGAKGPAHIRRELVGDRPDDDLQRVGRRAHQAARAEAP